MTKEQFLGLNFKFVSHISFDTEHTSTYRNDQYGFLLARTNKVKKNGDFGKTKVEYFHKKWYSNLDKFLEAIKDVEFKG